jgi:hypothetical protein
VTCANLLTKSQWLASIHSIAKAVSSPTALISHDCASDLASASLGVGWRDEPTRALHSETTLKGLPVRLRVRFGLILGLLFAHRQRCKRVSRICKTGQQLKSFRGKKDRRQSTVLDEIPSSRIYCHSSQLKTPWHHTTLFPKRYLARQQRLHCSSHHPD